MTEAQKAIELRQNLIMSILVNKNTRLIVQELRAEYLVAFKTSKMKHYGCQRAAGGVSPGKGGQIVEGIPVFNTVDDAVKRTGKYFSIILSRHRWLPIVFLKQRKQALN